MATFEDLAHGIKKLSTVPSNAGGKVLNDNFTAISNTLTDLESATPTSLAELTDDVNIDTTADTQVLQWDGASGKWVNGLAVEVPVDS